MFTHTGLYQETWVTIDHLSAVSHKITQYLQAVYVCKISLHTDIYV